MFDEEVDAPNVFSEEDIIHISEEYSRLTGVCYLDHVGCPPYPNSIIEGSCKNLLTNVYGNPHSGGQSSKNTSDLVDQVRYRVLQHFHTSSEEYSVIFTSGATAALKLLAESFVWGIETGPAPQDARSTCGKPSFVYLEDNHTSVLGMRELVQRGGAEVSCLQEELAGQLFEGTPSSTGPSPTPAAKSLFVYPAMSNFSGVKYPLSWIDRVHAGALNDIPSIRTGQSKWFCLLDAASFVSTSELDLGSVKPDFVAISFYKMFGWPTGVGALLVRHSACELLAGKPYYGGGTVFLALSQKNHWVPRTVLHERFEDGTINFLSIISLIYGFNYLEKGVSFQNISRHTFELCRYAYLCLSRLHHGNGQPLARIYRDTAYESSATQGNILNFNLLRPDGQFIGFAEVLNLANLYGIHLRTGCFCNPGACRRHLGLSTEDVRKQFVSGHVCGDDNDLIDGRPTGSVRVSFGPYNTPADVHRLLTMIVDCFAFKPVIHRTPEDSSGLRPVDSRREDSPLLAESSGMKMDETVKKSCFLYFWLENVGSILPEQSLETASESRLQVTSAKENSSSTRPGGGEEGVRLSHMFIYPVKSCGRLPVSRWELSPTGLKYDREWMITNDSGVALTQKTEPRLCLIRPIIDLKQNKLFLTFKGHPKLGIDLEENGPELSGWLCTSKVCRDEVRGQDCGEEVADWLSLVLQRPGLRLIRQRTRAANTQGGGALSLSNQAQYLLINKASVDWLAGKLDSTADCKKESMLDRFRSNFVVTGFDEPFVEQTWKEVKIGEQSFVVDGPCSRCQMICIDQDSGWKTKEPLTTLQAAVRGKMKFGVYLSVRSPAHLTSTLNIGDPISSETSSE